MAEQVQKIDLPDYLQNLLKERAELRSDVLNVAMGIVFKVAEINNTFLNAQYILNNVVGARVCKDDFRVIAELYLINGMLIKAVVTEKDSFIVFDSVMQCNC